MLEQTTLKISLQQFRPEGYKVEALRVLDELLGEFGLHSWKGP